MANTKATRMEYLKLKKRGKTAKRGHKLLKEKRDGLMKRFMEIIREAKTKRKELEEKIDSLECDIHDLESNKDDLEEDLYILEEELEELYEKEND